MKNNKFSFVLSMLVAIALMGCKGDENVQHYTNKLFISATSFANEIRIEENESKISRNVIVQVAKPEAHDVSAQFKAAPELLATYCEAYYDVNVLLLPQAHYDLSQAEATITAGKIASNPLILDFVGLDQLNLDARYVLPVTIASAKGVEVLQSAKTLYYIFKEASLVNIVADIKENRAWPEWGTFDQVENMSAFTMETLIYGHAFKNESSVHTIMGIEDVFLVRIGDVLLPANQIQVAYGTTEGEDSDIQRGNITDASLKLQADRWYHLAVTFDRGDIKVYLDGKMKASGNSSAQSITSVNFKVPHSEEDDGKPRCFWIGYSYDSKRYLDGMISEVRFWNKALTAEEITAPNHFYRIAPDSDGLIAYWKFDEGEGNIVKDHTLYGNDLNTESDLKWIPVELPIKE